MTTRARGLERGLDPPEADAAPPGPESAVRSPAPAVFDRDATRRYYDDHAAAYAAATFGADLRAVWEPFEARLAPGAAVADLGAGSGRDLLHFAGRGLAPVGLDRSEPLARIARLASGRPVVVGDLTALPFGDATFDGVWAAAAVVHFTAHEAAPALAEMRRVLRSGGTALVTLKAGVGTEVDAHGRWTLLYSPEGARRALALAGFGSVDVTTSCEVRAGRTITWLALAARAAAP